MFSRKKRILKNLEASFGKIKTEGFNFDLISRYHLNKDNTAVFQVLSDQTCHDLDFDLFFCYVDRTCSKPGQQYLYDRLRSLNYASEEVKRNEEAIQYLDAHPEIRLNIQYQLQKLNTQQAYYIPDLFQQKNDTKSKWYFLIPLLAAASLSSLVLSFFISKAILIFLGLFPVNVFLHYGLKRRTNLFINAIPSLLTLGSVAKNSAKYKQLKVSLPDIDESLKVISVIRRKLSFFKLEQKVDSDMEAAYWYLLELIKITFLLEPLLYFSSLDTLRNKSKAIETLFRFIGKVDFLVSVNSLRNGSEHICIPEINPGNTVVQIENMRHPFIVDCVPNTIKTNRSVLLTGSNMSGKTTFIRSIGLNFISGMGLNTCFASSASLPVAKLFSVIRIEDDIMSSSSYFYRELDEIKKILDEIESGCCSLILLDELFKGTNTIERIASARAVLTHMAAGNSQIFVSTHDIELTTMLNKQFELFHFSEFISGSEILFDYKLKSGVPEKGNAIRILEINGFPKELIRNAKCFVGEV
ncbi:MAG: MutS-related protein [Bacteroidota bacterium]